MSDKSDEKIIEYGHHESALPVRRRWQKGDTLGLLAYVVSLWLTLSLVHRVDPPVLAMAVALPVASFARRWVRKRAFGNAPDPDVRFEAGFRVVTWALTLIVIVGSFRVFRCPHGHAYGIGPVGVAYRSVAPVEHPYRRVSSTRAFGQWRVWVRY